MTHFSLSITDWYRRNKRDLPWRHTNDPYKIWLSEIILQQTRVAQGMDYYLKFVKHYPKVEDLANADEQEVLRLWQGLGYYSRARNLHFAAKTVVNDFGGKFPDTYKDVLSLKGVGEYTAAAISSFAYNLPHPVIDGNVYRVLSRFFGEETPIDSTIGKKVFKEKAALVFDEKNPAEHNQAIMEFGALMCTPKTPNCAECPLQDACVSLREGVQLELPKKTKKIKVTKRYFEYFVPDSDQFVWLKKREGKGIWQNMYEFPVLEFEKQITEGELLLASKKQKQISDIEFINEFKHILSHQHIYARFWRIGVNELQGYEVIQRESIDDYPISRLIDKFLEAEK